MDSQHLHQSSVRLRDQTPNKHVQVQNSTGVCSGLHPSRLIFLSSLLEEYKRKWKPQYYGQLNTPPLPPQWIITVRSYSLKGQEKRFVSPPLYTVSHSKSQWCLGGDDRAVCSFLPKLPDPLPPSLLPSSLPPPLLPPLLPQSVIPSLSRSINLLASLFRSCC